MATYPVFVRERFHLILWAGSMIGALVLTGLLVLLFIVTKKVMPSLDFVRMISANSGFILGGTIGFLWVAVACGCYQMNMFWREVMTPSYHRDDKGRLWIFANLYQDTYRMSGDIIFDQKLYFLCYKKIESGRNDLVIQENDKEVVEARKKVESMSLEDRVKSLPHSFVLSPEDIEMLTSSLGGQIWFSTRNKQGSYVVSASIGHLLAMRDWFVQQSITIQGVVDPRQLFILPRPTQKPQMF